MILVAGYTALSVFVFGLLIVAWLKAISDFDSARVIRRFGAFGFIFGMAGQFASDIFVQFSSFMPNQIVADFHQWFSEIDNLSQATLWLLTIGALVFHLLRKNHEQRSGQPVTI